MERKYIGTYLPVTTEIEPAINVSYCTWPSTPHGHWEPGEPGGAEVDEVELEEEFSYNGRDYPVGYVFSENELAEFMGNDWEDQLLGHLL